MRARSDDERRRSTVCVRARETTTTSTRGAYVLCRPTPGLPPAPPPPPTAPTRRASASDVSTGRATFRERPVTTGHAPTLPRSRPGGPPNPPPSVDGRCRGRGRMLTRGPAPGLGRAAVGRVEGTRARVVKGETIDQKFTVYGSKMRVLTPERSKRARLERTRTHTMGTGAVHPRREGGEPPPTPPADRVSTRMALATVDYAPSSRPDPMDGWSIRVLDRGVGVGRVDGRGACVHRSRPVDGGVGHDRRASDRVARGRRGRRHSTAEDERSSSSSSDARDGRARRTDGRTRRTGATERTTRGSSRRVASRRVASVGRGDGGARDDDDDDDAKAVRRLAGAGRRAVDARASA